MKDDRLYLIHILECIGRIEQYTATGRGDFFNDTKTQDATVRNLQVVAEATKDLSEAAKSRCPDIEWRSIVAFRNVVVHDYLNVDLEMVWDIVKQDLPRLKNAVQDNFARVGARRLKASESIRQATRPLPRATR